MLENTTWNYKVLLNKVAEYTTRNYKVLLNQLQGSWKHYKELQGTFTATAR